MNQLTLEVAARRISLTGTLTACVLSWDTGRLLSAKKATEGGWQVVRVNVEVRNGQDPLAFEQFVKRCNSRGYVVCRMNSKEA